VTKTWTTAYLAALADPGSTLPFLPQPRAFSVETVRQAVRLRRGGSTIRLELSNEFGTRPLRIDAVTVGGPASGPRPVRLRRADPWEIPPGSTATSDPVALPVAAGDQLVVSCFVAGATEPATFLHSAQQTAEIAPGDQLDRDRLVDAQQSGSLYWITRCWSTRPPPDRWNQALRTQREYPVVDFATAVADPTDPVRLAADLDSGDGVHPNDVGAGAIADAVDLALVTSTALRPAG
jgi:hypothetical protein